MFTFVEAKLIYKKVSEDERGNPIETLTERVVRGRIDSTFSDYYYNERGRSQQTSMNLNVNAYLVMPTRANETDGRIYQVIVNGTRYNVRAVLNDKTSKLRKVLDCEQVLN